MIQISKRGELSRGRALAVRAAGLAAGILLCALITVLVTGENPAAVFAAVMTCPSIQNRNRLFLIASSPSGHSFALPVCSADAPRPTMSGVLPAMQPLCAAKTGPVVPSFYPYGTASFPHRQG